MFKKEIKENFDAAGDVFQTRKMRGADVLIAPPHLVLFGF
jgi:hypothetical protein